MIPLKDLPLEAQPRENLLARGPGALSDAELLAILLRTGILGKGVLQMANDAVFASSIFHIDVTYDISYHPVNLEEKPNAVTHR